MTDLLVDAGVAPRERQETAEDMEDKLDDYRLIGYGGGYLTIRTIGEKVLDGALGTHGGWLLEPYNDLPRSSGFEVTPVTEIEASAALAIEHACELVTTDSEFARFEGLRWRHPLSVE